MKLIRLITLALVLCYSSNIFAQAKPKFQGTLVYRSSVIDGLNGNESKVSLQTLYFDKEKIMLDSVSSQGTILRVILDIEAKSAYVIDLGGATFGKMAIKVPFEFISKAASAAMKKQDNTSDQIKQLNNLKLKFVTIKGSKKIAGYACKQVLVTAPQAADEKSRNDTMTLWMSSKAGLSIMEYAGIFEALKGIEGMEGFVSSMKDVPSEVKDGFPLEIRSNKQKTKETQVLTLQKLEKTSKYAALFDISAYQVMDMGNMPMGGGSGDGE